ncbi:MAG TPA: hypothetical protein VMM57_05185 [Bacteroidota bacterium]|nr:hypothetical protein [Bacteroidota bacterium]
MNTGQMMLAAGALVLLGTTVITVDRMFGNQGTILRQTEIGVYAISLGTSILEEAQGMNFDEVTVNNAITSTSSLTAASSLGPESGETTTPASSTKFDDFDDYNNLTEGLQVAGVDSFTVKISVYYVNDSAPDTKVTTPTWYKRMDLKITSTAMTDTVKMSYIFSYFNFR